MNPVGQYSGAGRIAHSLEILIKNDDDSHDEDKRRREVCPVICPGYHRTEVDAEHESKVCNGTKEQTQCHNNATFDLIDQLAVDESRETIDERADKDNPTKAFIGDTILCCQSWHGQREVLSHEVKDGISYHCDENSAHLPFQKRLPLWP